MTTPQAIVFAAMCIPSIIGLGWLFFRTWARFFDAILFVLTPDIISLFRGRLSRDWWAEFTFGYFLISSLLVAAGEKWIVDIIWETLS